MALDVDAIEARFSGAPNHWPSAAWFGTQAKTDVPALIAEVRSLRARLAFWEDEAPHASQLVGPDPVVVGDE